MKQRKIKPHSLVRPIKNHKPRTKQQRSPRFPRPTDGKVNSFIKFNWPRYRTQGDRPPSIPVVIHFNDTADDDQTKAIRRKPAQSSSDWMASTHHPRRQTAQAYPQASLPDTLYQLPAYLGLFSETDTIDQQLFFFCTLRVPNFIKIFHTSLS
jgi:hypothetical protein